MKLSKTNKKIDSNVCKALTEVCEQAKVDIDGFLWLTHRANYTEFPGSLKVTCVFNSDSEMAAACDQQHDVTLRQNIQKQLLKFGIVLKDVRQNVQLDSEEACARQSDGQWDERLKLVAGAGYRRNQPGPRRRF